MAAANLLALLDDIATLMDDIATMSKVAAQKTAGVLGDDLAVNADQVLHMAGFTGEYNFVPGQSHLFRHCRAVQNVPSS